MTESPVNPTSGRHVTAPLWNWKVFGEKGRPAMVLLHGFTGRADFWTPLAERWGRTHRVLVPDLPGHGASEAPGPGYGLAEAAEVVAGMMPAAATLVGYSLGGRLALHIATAHPELVRRVIVIGASPGLSDEAARAQRRASDAEWASMLREEGLGMFLSAWEAQPLFAHQQTAPAERLAWLRGLRAGQSAEGFAASLEAFGLGAQADLAPALGRCPVPTWWVAGEQDPKFWAIAQQMAAAMPNAHALSVPDSGHNVPFERPEALIDLIDTLERA